MEDVDKDLSDAGLLFETAVVLNRKDDGIRRRDKGIISNDLTDVFEVDLCGESPSMIDHRLSIVSVPRINCFKKRLI